MSFRNYRLQNMCLCKCRKSHLSVHRRTGNMLKGPKHSCNLHDCTLSPLFVAMGKFESEKVFLSNI